MTEAASDGDVVCRESLIEVIDQTQGEVEDHDGVDTGHTYPQYRQASTPASPARCRNIAIMAVDPKEEIAGAGRGRPAPLRMTEAGTHLTGSRHSQSRVRHSRQRSAHRSASPRRVLGSPPPKHTPPLEDEWSSASRGRGQGQRSCSQSPRPVSPAARSGHSSPPLRRVSTPLYVIGPGDSDQRPVTPVPGMARPVLVKMATITSPPVINRSVSPDPVSITRSLDDTKCDYSSLDLGAADRGGDMAEEEVRDTVRLQKLFRKLQRQVHSPEHQVECLESLLQIADRRNRLQTGRRSFAEPSLRRHEVPFADSSNRRVTLGRIGRSETLAIPDCHDPTPDGRRSSKRRRLSGGSFRITPENLSNTSSGYGMDIKIEFESPNTPILERPTTLPEVNSRPASRVMKSFSMDEGEIERQKRKTATAIVTSGALTFMILAAALVTASFLMSPVIEDVFVHRKMNQSEDVLPENSTSITTNPYPFPLDDISSVHQSPLYDILNSPTRPGKLSLVLRANLTT